MCKHFFIFIFIFLSFGEAYAQQEIFQIYDTKTESIVSIPQLLKGSTDSDVIFFGELHNSSLIHWLQLQLLKQLFEQKKSIVLAGEFFEVDDQLNIDEWMAGFLTDKNFESEAKLWNNYLTDYKPLLTFAKSNNIPFTATNVPRKYASLVSRKGLAELEKLGKESLKYLPSLPLIVDKNLPSYIKMGEMTHSASMNIDFMIEAQALKDATMAESIFQALKKNQTVYHINGSYHSDQKEGIVWFLKQKSTNLKIITISTLEQDLPITWNEGIKNLADFIVVLPKDSPKSY